MATVAKSKTWGWAFREINVTTSMCKIRPVSHIRHWTIHLPLVSLVSNRCLFVPYVIGIEIMEYLVKHSSLKTPVSDAEIRSDSTIHLYRFCPIFKL